MLHCGIPVEPPLGSDAFERRTTAGSELFSLLICLGTTVFVLPSVLILIKTICPNIGLKALFKIVKSTLPVDVRRSKTLDKVDQSDCRIPRRLVVCQSAARNKTITYSMYKI